MINQCYASSAFATYRGWSLLIQLQEVTHQENESVSNFSGEVRFLEQIQTFSKKKKKAAGS